MKPEDKYGPPYVVGGYSGPRVNIRGAIQYLQNLRPFVTAHCHAKWVPIMDTRSEDERIRMDVKGEKRKVQYNYCVYSGSPDTTQSSIPLFIYNLEAQQWFERHEMLFGKITTRTRKRFRPLIGDTLKLDTHNMQMLLCFGYRHMAILRLNRDRTNWGTEGTITGRWRTS